jgi:ABC-type thiamine transport system ATPase subunit
LVLLNVTGGGRRRRQLENELVAAQPALELDEKEVLLDETLERIVDLYFADVSARREPLSSS